MSATVLPMRPPAPPPAEDDWLTLEAVQAYYIAISFEPEIIHADDLVRAGYVNKALAGMRMASHVETEADRQRMLNCIALMKQDADAAAARKAKGGW